MAWAMLHPNTKQRLPFNTFADWYLKGTLNEGIKESTASFLAGEDLHYYLNDEIGDEKKGKTAPTKTTRRSKHVLSGKVLDEEIAMLDRIVHEEGILELAQNVDKLNAFWKEIAHSDGNVVSPTVKLEDVGVWIKKKFPMLDHGNALSQAYRRTQITSKKADDSGRWVSTDDCPALLAHLVFYNKILMCKYGYQSTLALSVSCWSHLAAPHPKKKKKHTERQCPTIGARRAETNLVLTIAGKLWNPFVLFFLLPFFTVPIANDALRLCKVSTIWTLMATNR